MPLKHLRSVILLLCANYFKQTLSVLEHKLCRPIAWQVSARKVYHRHKSMESTF